MRELCERKGWGWAPALRVSKNVERKRSTGPKGTCDESDKGERIRWASVYC